VAVYEEKRKRRVYVGGYVCGYVYQCCGRVYVHVRA
jgi:uncharacterized metal-binding protein YceD (DUF177 family)